MALNGNEQNTLDDLIDDGWIDAIENPPDTDRTVRVAWDDGSFGDASLGFYDTACGKENEGKVWWTHPGMARLQAKSVIAWRERDAAK